MGFGLPAAIGAKFGTPDKEVILFAGDGGIQMTVQELGTISQENLAVKIVVLNNDFLGMVRGGMISHCPLTANAVKNAHQIFGPDLAGIRGRTVRRPPESVTTNYVQIPRAVLERHQLVTLAVDVMFVNGVPFLVSVARGLNLVTAEFTP